MSKALKPIPRRKYIQKLKSFGIVELPDEGKGGEWKVERESTGEFLTLPHLSSGDEVKVCYISQTLRRFKIDRDAWLRA